MPESTINKYDQRAAGYEAKWEKYLAHTHRAFVKHIETEADDIILDASGGTGMLARQLTEHDFSFKQVVVNDPSEEMLDIARKRLSDNPKVEFSNHPAEKLLFEKQQFDRIFCLNSFHFYADQQQVLNHFYALLKPDGKLYLLDWNREGYFRMVNLFIKWSGSEYIDTRSLPELKMMFQHSGFSIETSESWSWRYWRFMFIEGHKSQSK